MNDDRPKRYVIALSVEEEVFVGDEKGNGCWIRALDFEGEEIQHEWARLHDTDSLGKAYKVSAAMHKAIGKALPDWGPLT